MIEYAYAADAAAQGTGGVISSFAPLILILVIFWFLVMRPQQQKYKRHLAMVNALKRGDKVITSSGIKGKITKVDERFFTVEIAEGVEIELEKNAISEHLDAPANNTPNK